MLAMRNVDFLLFGKKIAISASRYPVSRTEPPRDLEDARQIISAWRDHYNHVRPHSSLGYIPPAVFAQQAA